MNKGFGVAKTPAKKKQTKRGPGAAERVDGFPYSGTLRPGIQTPRREVCCKVLHMEGVILFNVLEVNPLKCILLVTYWRL